MDVWLELILGDAVGLSSVIVILSTLGITLFLFAFFVYKAMNDKSPH